MGEETLKRKTGVARLSVVSNTLLVCFKLVVGLLTGSVSILSEALHSAVDLIAAAIALFAVKKAGEPEDEHHRFGHGKFENISGFIEALLIFVAALWIIYEAISKLLHPEALQAIGWGVTVMVISALANTLVSSMLFKVAKETDSIALQADGWHLRTDVWTSAGVAVGLGVMMIGEKFAPPTTNLHWIDPVAALVVALLILKAAWKLTRQSLKDLLDTSLDEEEVGWIEEYLRQLPDGACGYHHLRTRKAGPVRFIELHLLVKPEMTVEASHELADELVAAIKRQFDRARVLIHVEPCKVPKKDSRAGNKAADGED